MKQFLIIFTTLLLLTISPAKAQSPTLSLSPTSLITPSVTATMSPPEVNTSEIRGELLKVEGQVLTISTDEGAYQVNLPSNIIVKRDNNNVAASQLLPGDMVTITQTQTGEVLGIDSTSAERSKVMNSILPLLVLGLVGAGFIWWMLKRTTQKHIKTS